MIFVVFLILCIFIVTIYFSSPKGKGKLGEFTVRRKIGKTLEGKRYIFNDVYFNEDGKSIQIDHILISTKGVIVLETKNYSGRIYGKENQQEWTQVLAYGKRKNKFYNPIKQNNTHCYYVNKIIGENTPTISLIVFIQNNTQYIDADNVIGVNVLKKKLKCLPNIISDDKVVEIANKIKNHISHTHSNKEHIKKINKMKNQINNLICPRCNSKLVLRNGKYGEFYGCEKYPQCKFIKKK